MALFDSNMLAFVVLLMLTIPISIQQNEDLEIITITDKNEHELSFEGSERPHEYLINIPESFKLIVKVEKLDVKSEHGDYLLIKRGPLRDTEGTGLVLTEKAIPDKPLLISSNQVYIKLFLHKLENDNVIRKFTLKYTAHGKSLITTTETPTTTKKWPTPGAHDKIHYNAHLYGLRAIDFVTQRKGLLDLRLAISRMADAYCRDQAMRVAENITPNNVIIADLVRCPYQWPDSEKCVRVNFAVPVVMKEGYDGYELLAKHLEVMWNRYDYILREHNFENYKIMDIDSEVILWDATFITCFLLFILAIIIVALICFLRPKCFSKIFGRPNKPEARSIITQPEQRETYASNESEYERFRESANIFKGST